MIVKLRSWWQIGLSKLGFGSKCDVDEDLDICSNDFTF